jgi:hypothetical protein
MPMRVSSEHVPREVCFTMRLLLVCTVWVLGAFGMLSGGPLIAVLGEDYYSVWAENSVCVALVTVTWALLWFSRSVCFSFLFGTLVILMLYTYVSLVSAVGIGQLRFFP